MTESGTYGNGMSGEGTWPEPGVVTEALQLLVAGRDNIKHGGGKQSLGDQLLANTEVLEKALLSESKFAMLSQAWQEDKPYPIYSDCQVSWMFVQYCLKGLHLLNKSIIHSVECYEKASSVSSASDICGRDKYDNLSGTGKRPTPKTPGMSPDTLSFAQQKVVRGVVQFVVCLGVCPNLEPGVGLPISARSGYSDLVNSLHTDQTVDKAVSEYRLYRCMKCLMSCAINPALGTLILTQHLPDLLASLMQLNNNGMKTFKEKAQMKKNTVLTGFNEETDTESTTETQSSHVTENSTVTVKQNTKQDNLSTDRQISNSTGLGDVKNDQNNEKASSFLDKTLSNSEQGTDAIVMNNKQASTSHGISESPGSLPEGPAGCRTDSESDMNKVDYGHCKECMDDLIKKVYPPLLVKTLLLLQGGPKPKNVLREPAAGVHVAPVWLRQKCGCLLSAIIMRPRGVQSLLRGMLDTPGDTQGMGGAADWRKCDAVAKVIACCPLQSQSVNNYYKLVGPQLLELVEIRDRAVCRQFLRVACSTLGHMWRQHPDLASLHVIGRLLQPLSACSVPQDVCKPGQVIVEEVELSRCVENCHKVFVCGCTDVPKMVTCLQPVIMVLYQLYFFTKHGVSTLKTACHELVVAYLKQTDAAVALTCVQQMTFLRCRLPQYRQCAEMLHQYRFAYTGTGNVAVVVTENERLEPGELPASGEGGRLPDVECVVDILKDLHSTCVPADLLLHLLQELTNLIERETSGDVTEDSAGVGEMYQYQLTLLSTLASLCETIGPDCIRDAKQTLVFIKATLERSVRVCQATEDPTLGSLESETLTMAMGLLTALLTGAFQLTDSDKATMQELLPLLQEISTNHPQSSVQDMATDLRIAIATHGHVWSEKARSSRQDFQDIAEKLKQERCKKDTKDVKPPVKIQVLSETSAEENHENPSSSTVPATHRTKNSRVSEARTQKSPEAFDGQQTDADSSSESKGGAFLDKTQHSEQTEASPKTRSKQTVDISTGISTSDNRNTTNEAGYDEQTAQSLQTLSLNNKHIDNNMNENTSNDSKEKLESVGGDLTGPESSPELEMVYKELLDTMIPVRGHGLIRLTRLVNSRDACLKSREDVAWKIFEENLDHGDSYIYLSAINGLSAMCDVYPERFVSRLCALFAGFTERTDGVEANKGMYQGSSASTGVNKGIYQGSSASTGVNSGSQAEDGVNTGAQSSQRGARDSRRAPHSVELKMKLGEVMVRAARSLGELVPGYRDVLLRSMLAAVRSEEALVRASSLSNLGELCKLLHFSLGPVIQEVMTCVSGTVQLDSDIAVRKAAAQVISLLLQGLGQQAIQVLGTVLRDVYRLLKLVLTTERDDGVKLHVQLALTELDDIMRQQLFPPQKLEKRIRVLDWD